ncbi:MAG: AraC family transcriptional regulator [Flavobacterium sp.]
MRNIYLLFHLFSTVLTALGQTQKQDRSADFYLNNLFEKVNSTSKTDTVLYKNTVNNYLKKAKKAHQATHIFNAYYFYAVYESDPKEMHLYTDSLTQYARKTKKTLNIIKAYQARSTIYYIEKNYKKSLEYELAALQLIDKDNQGYEYHKTLYGIGLTHFYLQQYQEASDYFGMARTYFEGTGDYNHLRGYMNSILYEALTASYLGNYDYSNELLKTANEKLSKIKAEGRALEKAYLDYVYGINLYHLKKNNQSIEVLKGTLEEIKNNEDYANEHNVYYYLGLNYHVLGQKEEAIGYFNRIDKVFKTEKYINLEIKNAYNFLISYYKELKNEEKELYYTNQSLNATVYLQSEYKHLSTALHKQLDIKHLEAEKKRLEHSLRVKDLWLEMAFGGGSMILIALTILLIQNHRKKKEYLKRYNELAALRKNLKTEEKILEVFSAPETLYLPVANTPKAETASSNEDKTSVKKTEKGFNAASIKTLDEILTHLDHFENNLDFLNSDINLNQLATLWHTNRSYLSTLINQYKGKGFTDYVNQLRIEYLLKNLEEDPNWKKYKIAHLAELLGFSSSRSFSNAFLKATGISPSFYIQKLQSEDENN